MMNSLKLQNPSSIKLRHLQNSPENNNRRLYHTTAGIQKSSFSSSIRFSSISLKPLQSDASSSSTTTPEFTTSSIGSPNISHWNLTSRHITLLNLMACSVALSATWLFCSAIPTLLAFRRAAESLAKLLDVTREELPDTMAAMRLSGMEISDLTMELSDLGQEITKGVKSSTRAVRVAKERLHRLTNMTPSATLQEVAKPKTEVAGPRLARTARIAREGIVKGRTFWNMFLSLSQFSRMAQNFFASRAERYKFINIKAKYMEAVDAGS